MNKTNEIKFGLNEVVRSVKMSISDARENSIAEFSTLFPAHVWFTEPDVKFAINCFSSQLEDATWLGDLPEGFDNQSNIAFYFRGNAALEGFDLLVQALFSGCRCQINIRENERGLLNFLLENFFRVFPEMESQVQMVKGVFQRFDGFISIGEPLKPLMAKYLSSCVVMNQTAKHNIALITGDETSEELDMLAMDICMHFGRALGSIQQILVPGNYDFSLLIAALNKYNDNRHHARYFNHYEYRKAVLLINNIPHFDLGHLLITNDQSQKNQVSVLVYSIYQPDNESDINFMNPLKVADFGKVNCSYFEDSKTLKEFLIRVQMAAV